MSCQAVRLALTQFAEGTIMERPNTDDDSAFMPDPPPSSDPEPKPRVPKSPRTNHDARPETLADNTKVTPLDEDKNLENGIEVNET
jgi:hypothetical protein